MRVIQELEDGKRIPRRGRSVRKGLEVSSVSGSAHRVPSAGDSDGVVSRTCNRELGVRGRSSGFVCGAAEPELGLKQEGHECV